MNAYNSSMSEHVFELADQLQLKLTVETDRVTDCIEGQEDYTVAYENGLTLKFATEIEDSAIYKERLMVCAVAHHTGNLYSIHFIDGRKGEMTLMLVDGSKLEWKPATIKLFPHQWDEYSSRADIYAKIYKGVVGGALRKKGYQSTWLNVPKADLLTVLSEKLIAAGLMTTDGLIIEKPKAQPKQWNTIGPRGF